MQRAGGSELGLQGRIVEDLVCVAVDKREERVDLEEGEEVGVLAEPRAKVSLTGAPCGADSLAERCHGGSYLHTDFCGKNGECHVQAHFSVTSPQTFSNQKKNVGCCMDEYSSQYL